MFGEDILFALIMEKGQVERAVYLPKGEWVSVIDKSIYQGKQWLTVHAELNQYIAFVKKDGEALMVFED